MILLSNLLVIFISAGGVFFSNNAEAGTPPFFIPPKQTDKQLALEGMTSGIGEMALREKYIDNGYKVIFVVDYDENGNPISLYDEYGNTIKPDSTIYDQCNNLDTVTYLNEDWEVSYSDTYYHQIVCK